MKKDREPVHANEWIGPEKAEKYLALNKLNRPMSEKRVREFVQMLEADWWSENGEQGVTFDWNGVLAGGQHFLEAVRRSGKTVRVRVTRGVDPAARMTMNDSARQSFAQDLATYGNKDANKAEALLRKILVWEAAEAEHGSGGLARWQRLSFGRGYLSNRWPEFRAEIAHTLSESRTWDTEWCQFEGNTGALAFMYWLITEKYGYSETTARDFFNMIAFGATDADERALARGLRGKFRENRRAGVQVWWLIRVWNAWQKNEKLQKLQYPKNGMGDPYPKLTKER